MKPSREFLSLPIISLREGQQIGNVKNLIIDASEKTIAALVIDPKGFFKDQRIIPYSKVVSVGSDAITIDKESQVEKSSNLPEILNLIKEKLSIIGTKVMTESGKTLGVAQEYYIDPATGEVTDIELSGGKLEGLFSGKALLSAKSVLTIGHDVIIAEKGSEGNLIVAKQGLNHTMRSFLHSTSHKASESAQGLTKWVKEKKSKKSEDEVAATDEQGLQTAMIDDFLDSSQGIEKIELQEQEQTQGNVSSAETPNELKSSEQEPKV